MNPGDKIIKAFTAALLLFSCMTFCVAKEVYDPHLGTGGDIFCKSLYAVGDDFFPCFTPVDRPALIGWAFVWPALRIPSIDTAVKQLRAPPRPLPN